MRQAEMFAETDFGTARPSLSRARDLVADVERLLNDDEGFDYVDDAHALARKARRMGAHSVARALDWSTVAMVERYGCEHCDIVVGHVARRWLARLERSA